MRRVVAIAGFAWGLVACGGGGGDDSAGTTTLRGQFVLADSSGIYPEIDGTCFGIEGYDDIETGTDVTVRNGGGDVIATGALTEGHYPEPGPDDFGDPDECRFRFTIPDVPDADFYSVEVSRRGEINYSRDDLEEENWRVDLSLG